MAVDKRDDRGVTQPRGESCALLPPPTLRGTKDYADDLRARFRTSGAGQPPKAFIAITVLEQVERAIAAVLPTLTLGEPARKLDDAETAVRAALNTYRQEENTSQRQ